MPQENANIAANIDNLFPSEFRHLLNLGGDEFIDRVGPEALKNSTFHILCGNNVRTQTEPMTRQRIAEIAGSLLLMYSKGLVNDVQFKTNISQQACDAIARSPRKNEIAWPLQWLIGITGKSTQNVLRSDPAEYQEYISNFDEALQTAARTLTDSLGELRLDISVHKDGTTTACSTDWEGYARLAAMIGCAELAIRGSDKSRFGKLFERLVLASSLSVLGFKHQPDSPDTDSKVFWLSDSSQARESDATAIIEPGLLARFDIGFIGIGNPEIVRDKLTRFASRIEREGVQHDSVTFIIVDRVPDGPRANTRNIADDIGVELIQMNMSYWVRDLAIKLRDRCGYQHPVADMDDQEIHQYLKDSMQEINLLNYVPNAMKPD